MAPRSTVSPRDRLLDVADELFYREGIRAVGIDAIIARARVAKASLYNHFRSKDDLIVAWLERRDAQFTAWFVGAVERRATDPRARILAVFDALHEWFQTDDFRGCAFLNSCAELPDADHPARSIIVTAKRRTRDYLRSLARAAHLAHPDALGDRLALLAQGAIVTAVFERDPGAALIARAAAEDLISAHLPPSRRRARAR